MKDVRLNIQLGGMMVVGCGCCVLTTIGLDEQYVQNPALWRQGSALYLGLADQS